MISTARFRLNDWQVDPASNTLVNAELCIKLDPRPMQVLVVLAHATEVLSQRQIEDAVWGGLLVTSNSVYQCITQLRKALGDDARHPQYIETIPRRGYRLIAKVDWSVAASAPTAIAPELSIPEPAAPAAAAPLQTTLPAIQPRTRWRYVGLSILIALLAGVGIEAKHIVDQRTLAHRERERAALVSQFMLEVFAAADPFVNLGRPASARELLEERARHLGTDLQRDPLLHAEVLEIVGRTYRRQGLYEPAVPLLEEALQIRRHIDDQQPEIGSLLAELGVAFHNLGRFADCERAFAAALEIRATASSRRSKQYARLLADIGMLELTRSHPRRAVYLLNEGLQLLRALPDADEQQIAVILENLGEAHLWLNDTVSAERAARSAFEIHQHTLPPSHPDRVLTTYGLGEVLRLGGFNAQAEPLLLAALTAQRQLYASKGAQVARTLDSLAALRFAQGQQALAAQLTGEAMAAYQTNVPDPADGRLALVRQSLSRGDFAAVERDARAVLEGPATLQLTDAQQIAIAEHFLGEALLGQRRLSEAETILRSAAGRWQQLEASGWRSALCRSALGEVLQLAGQRDEAEPLLLASYRTVAIDLEAEQSVKRTIYQRLARFYAATGGTAELLQLETGYHEPPAQHSEQQ